MKMFAGPIAFVIGPLCFIIGLIVFKLQIMAGNSFGQIFRITTFGESHGAGIGVVVDGCPAGLELNEEDVQVELDRRRPGQSKVTTPRSEKDKVEIVSGVFEGKTTGAPIMMMARNQNTKSEDYEHLKNLYRPSHADYVYDQKYGHRDWRGGGRSSARETWARVAAGAVARKFLKEKAGVEILSFVEKVGPIAASVAMDEVTLKDIESNIMRCPDADAAEEMIALVEELRDEGDSVGGVVMCVVRGCPVGLGDPVFDKLNADLAKACMSINAVKGFEIGSGFAGSAMRGSMHNDEFEVDKKGQVTLRSNWAGGVLAGISSGADIYFRVAFKPTSTIMKEQETVTKDGKSVKLEARGRHDPCVVPRAVPIVDAMTAVTLMDHYLRNKAIDG